MGTYHLCFTSHSEVMFRNEDDMNMGFNSLCSALCKTGSTCYAYAAMSDHHHGCYASQKPVELIRTTRESYTKQFNSKYRRTGPLGEPGCYIQEVVGLKHFLAAVSYTLKNPPHHGVTQTPFEYPYSSANAYFRKELGKDAMPEKVMDFWETKAALPRRAAFETKWKMSPAGVFLPETVLDIGLVENSFATVQAFNYYMGRKSGTDWMKEQEDENGTAPFSLESMEAPLIDPGGVTVAEMLRNEKSRYVTAPISDLELCKVIDTYYVPRYGKFSVYELAQQEKLEIANILYKDYHAGARQIKRCLVM